MALTKVSYSMIQGAQINVQDYGAVGNGTTDDTAAIQAAFDTGLPVWIPYTVGGYKVTSTLTAKNTIYSDNATLLARLTTTNAPVLNLQLVGGTFRDAGNLTVQGLNISGNLSQITNNIYGFKVPSVYYGIKLIDCYASNLYVGYLIQSFETMLLGCVGYSCTKGVSAYAVQGLAGQFNALNIIGGSYASCGSYAIILGDTSFPDADTSAEAMGVNIYLEGFNCDLAPILVNRTHDITIQNVYFEYGTTGDYGLILGVPGGDDLVRNVIISNCSFQNMRFPIYCQAGINNLYVEPCYTKNHVVSFLRLTSEAYKVRVDTQLAVSTDVAQFIQLAFPNTATLANVNFNFLTVADQKRGASSLQGTLLDGTQLTNYTPAKWFPNGTLKAAGAVITNTFSAGAYYTTPYTGVAGTMAGNVITLTNPTQSYEFNGGDAVTVSADGTATFIKSVDYLTGTITCNGTGATGATTISQNIVVTNTYTLNANNNLSVTAVSSANSAALTVANNPANPTVSTQVTWNKQTTGDNTFNDFYTETVATQRGSISYNRAGGLTAYNTTSDYRSKDIFGDVENAGEIIDALKIYRGKMKGATIERPMLIAHEAQEITPYAVTGEKDAVNENGDPIYQQMDVSVYVPLLIVELQNLRQRLSTLENK